MNADTINSAILIVVGGVVTWIGNLILQRFKHRDDNAARQQDRDDKLAANSNSLAIELLKVARTEASALHQRISDLQTQLGELPALERRAAYFEEALVHLEAVVDEDSEIGRDAAEHNARLFLARMVALREAKGVAANREQVERAAFRQLEGKPE